MRETCLLAMSAALTSISSTSASISTSTLSSMRHLQQFLLLFDYRLNVVKRILIYVLITTRFLVEANNFDKSSSSTTTSTTTTPTKIQRTTASTKMFAALNLLLNRTSSDIFMSDDIADAAAVVDVVAPTMLVTINDFDANNFCDETINDTNQNAKEFRKQNNKRNKRDDLLGMTSVKENTIASTIQTTTTMMNKTNKATTKLPADSKTLTTTAKATANNNQTTAPILSRSKRFLTFPEGASFSVAVCFTIGFVGNPRFNYGAFGLNWGVAYDLPNSTWVINHLHGYKRQPVPASVLKRRTRRALYKEIELIVDNMGYNGRECVLRALCESRQYFSKNKLSMIGEMMRVVFSLPKQRIFTRELHENSEIQVYDRAYRHAREISCEQQYDCTFSLLELAFGKYSTPPEGYY